MISVDGVILGATSPRTLVFTGVAHECPPSVPFRSPKGRLSDPVAYYKRIGDQSYLRLLAGWLNGFIASLQQNQGVRRLLGHVPAATGAAARIDRLDPLIEQLNAWRAELVGMPPAEVSFDLQSPFGGAPYNMIKKLTAPQDMSAEEVHSQLFLQGRKDVIVYFNSGHHPNRGSKVVNIYGGELVSEHLKVYKGRWVEANKPVPLPKSVIPDNIQVIEDPVVFFEDALIQVNLPDNPDVVYHLRVGNEQSSRAYLFPFKSELLHYLSPGQIAKNT
jgi:hypothetical protein